MAKLVVFRGDAVEREIRLTGNTVRIGRHSTNDIVLDDGSNGVSRFHGEIRREGGRYVIFDAKSRNGIWINGRRIKEKQTLEMGEPATVGAFELALEDDLATTTFGEDSAHGGQQTVLSPGGAHRGNATGLSAPGLKAGGRRPSPTPDKRKVLLWSSAAGIVLLICAVPFAVVRMLNNTEPEPPRTISPVAVAPPPVEEVPPPVPQATPAEPVEPPPLTVDEPPAPLAPPSVVVAPVRGKAPEVGKPDVAPAQVPGIPLRPGESQTDYQNRAQRVAAAYGAATRSLERDAYADALGQLQIVVNNQPNYRDVEQLRQQAQDKQKVAVERALISGREHEGAGRLREAWQSYQIAATTDPKSANAKEKSAAVLLAMRDRAKRLFDQAAYSLNLSDPAAAKSDLEKILDLLPEGEELRTKAKEKLELMKR